jgi:dTDP-4-amino-4,6-dideoxygalactose transaminase
MAKLDMLIEERRQCAMRYSQLLASVDELILPTSASNTSGHTFQSYVVRALKGGRERRNQIMAALASKGISTRPGTHAVHRLGYYRDKYGFQPQDFPAAALCEDTTITLPIFPGMTDADQQLVASTILDSLSSH